MQNFGITVEYLNKLSKDLLKKTKQTFLEQQLSHLLLYTSHIIQSGQYKSFSKTLKDLGDEDNDIFYSIKDLNKLFLLLAKEKPILTLQWCNILNLIEYMDISYWKKLLLTDELRRKSVNCNLEIIRRCSIVLFSDNTVSCDYD